MSFPAHWTWKKEFAPLEFALKGAYSFPKARESRPLMTMKAKCFPTISLGMKYITIFTFTVKPLHTDIQYNDKIQYNDNSNGMIP